MGIQIIDKLFGMGYVFNIDFIIKDSTSGGYTSTGDLSRGAFIAAIENGFLDTAWKKLFGLGLGNCESGTIFADATPFYLRYRVWALQDARIKVVHKKNGGLSDARNEGLRKSSGKYICFVDSDDYVSTKFVETLYELLHEYNTDMSAVSHKNVFSEEQEGYENTNHKEITTIFEGEEAIKQLFSNDTFANYAWNKMYNAQKLLDDYLTRLQSISLVITDRLHGMILSYITKTPCIVFDNNNQKN